MLIILLFIACSAIELQQEFTQFTSIHNKHYSESEYLSRYHIYQHNYNIIHNINSLNLTYHLEPNFFTDLTPEEQASYSMTPTPDIDTSLGYHQMKGLNDYIDWGTLGKVMPPKSQYACGDCYTFAAVGALESLYAIKYDQLVAFSEQELTDCGVMYGQRGCNGGMSNVFDYVANYGIHRPEDYGPFRGYLMDCKMKPNPYFKIGGYVKVQPYNNDLLLNALQTRPVWTTLDSVSPDFLYYKGGVLNSANCGVLPMHAVLIVGAGMDPTSKLEYWRIKNSWGPNWGENGYVRIKMDRGSGLAMCGLNLYPAYPVTIDEAKKIKE